MNNDERPSFDTQLFTWDEYHPESPMSMQFTNVALKVPVVDFAVGTKFPAAMIIGEASILILLDEAGEQHAYDLKVSVGEKVELPAHTHDHDSCDCGHEH